MYPVSRCPRQMQVGCGFFFFFFSSSRFIARGRSVMCPNPFPFPFLFLVLVFACFNTDDVNLDCGIRNGCVRAFLVVTNGLMVRWD
jgi:hypothetical protein